MSGVEVNFDGIVGPTHSYAGLAYGNLASTRHRDIPSSPRAAAREGLEKMKALADLGIEQAVLPPHDRPDVAALRRLGFAGTDAEVVERAARDDPDALAACASASAMWAANAATVSPSCDTSDGRVHLTPANLVRFFHRSLETETTAAVLGAIFNDAHRFALHEPLPASAGVADEGAANHMRLARAHGERGVEIFTYGDTAGDRDGPSGRFPARQTLAASRAVARLHRLDPAATIFVRQNRGAIDSGVFHNDVIAVGNATALLYHEDAFADQPAFIDELRRKLEAVCGVEPVLLEVPRSELTLAEAVSSYLFNSQLVTLSSGSMALVCPVECRENARAADVLARLRASEGPIAEVRFVHVRESMCNGGGPACLRLRMALNAPELDAMRPGVRLSEELYGRLCGWVERHYRDRLTPAELGDPSLLAESRTALDELTAILGLPAIYPFQRT